MRQLASALPSDDSAVTITRADLVALLEGNRSETTVGSVRDLTVEDIAEETGRAPSTVRGWLISGALRGYKLHGYAWRVPCTALREYLDHQPMRHEEIPRGASAVDITEWRRLLGA